MPGNEPVIFRGGSGVTSPGDNLMLRECGSTNKMLAHVKVNLLFCNRGTWVSPAHPLYLWSL